MLDGPRELREKGKPVRGQPITGYRNSSQTEDAAYYSSYHSEPYIKPIITQRTKLTQGLGQNPRSSSRNGPSGGGTAEPDTSTTKLFCSHRGIHAAEI